MKYRFKTDEELLASGYIKTPAGEFLHPTFRNVTPGMKDYASKFDDKLVEFLRDLDESPTFQCAFIDQHMYAWQHFIEA